MPTRILRTKPHRSSECAREHPMSTPRVQSVESEMKSEDSSSNDQPHQPLVDALLDSIRAYQRHKTHSGPLAAFLRKVARLKYNVLKTLTGADIGIEASLGRNLRMPHPVGIVIHRDAVIGNDCLIMQQTTIGMLAGPGVPSIGSRVYIGAGARVLGAIVIGDDARIGANAVVMIDVPAGATAVGVPAK